MRHSTITCYTLCIQYIVCRYTNIHNVQFYHRLPGSHGRGNVTLVNLQRVTDWPHPAVVSQITIHGGHILVFLVDKRRASETMMMMMLLMMMMMMSVVITEVALFILGQPNHAVRQHARLSCKNL